MSIMALVSAAKDDHLAHERVHLRIAKRSASGERNGARSETMPAPQSFCARRRQPQDRRRAGADKPPRFEQVNDELRFAYLQAIEHLSQTRGLLGEQRRLGVRPEQNLRAPLSSSSTMLYIIRALILSICSRDTSSIWLTTDLAARPTDPSPSCVRCIRGGAEVHRPCWHSGGERRGERFCNFLQSHT